MRLLMVEDSKRLQKYTAEGLRQAGYAVDVADDGEQGLWLIESVDYDVVILDILLPKMDGLSILEEMRKKEIETFVIMLTAKDTVKDKITGLERGADDYLVKPFALEELKARIDALVRRRYQVKSSLVHVDGLVINTAQNRVLRNGEEIKLQPREYSLLEYLAFRQGEVVKRADIEHHIYDELVEPMSNVVDSAICQLRKKIDTPGEESIIQTKRGVGYIITEARSEIHSS